MRWSAAAGSWSAPTTRSSRGSSSRRLRTPSTRTSDCGGLWSIARDHVEFDLRSSRATVCPFVTTDSGPLTLSTDGSLIAGDLELRRLDALGRSATRDDLLGAWHTPDNNLDIAFDDTIHFGPCQFAFVFRDGRILSSNPSCDLVSGPTSDILGTVLHGRPTVSGDDLWLETPQLTVHLVRGRSGIDEDVDLTDGVWVPEDLADFVDLPEHRVHRGGSFRVFGSCSTWSGTWS